MTYIYISCQWKHLAVFIAPDFLIVITRKRSIGSKWKPLSPNFHAMFLRIFETFVYTQRPTLCPLDVLVNPLANGRVGYHTAPIYTVA